jgi:hypothetical protein
MVFQTSSRNLHVDDELSDSKKNVGEKSQIPLVTTPRARMAKKALKTPDNNNEVRRSTRVKYLVQKLTYDGFVAHHYAYMVKVIQKVEPTCFEQAVGNPKWDNAMDEEMAVLDANATWEIGSFTKGQERNWVQMGVQSQTQCRWICE